MDDDATTLRVERTMHRLCLSKCDERLMAVLGDADGHAVWVDAVSLLNGLVALLRPAFTVAGNEAKLGDGRTVADVVTSEAALSQQAHDAERQGQGLVRALAVAAAAKAKPPEPMEVHVLTMPPAPTTTTTVEKRDTEGRIVRTRTAPA